MTQFVRWITGVTKDQSASFTTTSVTEYTATLTNEETSAGNVLKLVSGSSTIALFNKTGATLSVPLIGTGVLAGLFSATGQILYGSGGTAAATLNIGSTFQSLNVSAGVTAPQWMASLQSLLASAGSLVGASAANTPAHIPKGTAFQDFVMNAGATGQTWATGLLALAQTTADTFSANGANSMTRIAAGTAFQNWVLNAGASGVTWASCALAAAVTRGDLFYATGANSVVRLALGASGTFLSAGSTAPSWVAGSNVRNVATSASGATSTPTTSSTSYVDLNDMSCTLTTSGGDLIAWFVGTFYHGSLNAAIQIAFSLDGAAEVGIQTWQEAVASDQSPAGTVYRWAAPSSTSHTVKVRWLTNSGTATAATVLRYLVVMES